MREEFRGVVLIADGTLYKARSLLCDGRLIAFVREYILSEGDELYDVGLRLLREGFNDCAVEVYYVWSDVPIRDPYRFRKHAVKNVVGSVYVLGEYDIEKLDSSAKVPKCGEGVVIRFWSSFSASKFWEILVVPDVGVFVVEREGKYRGVMGELGSAYREWEGFATKVYLVVGESVQA